MPGTADFRLAAATKGFSDKLLTLVATELFVRPEFIRIEGISRGRRQGVSCGNTCNDDRHRRQRANFECSGIHEVSPNLLISLSKRSVLTVDLS